MCLAIPGRVAELYEASGVPMARVEFGGIAREACMAYLPEARDGDYVLVHAGFAISKMDEQEAERTLADLREMAALADEEAAAGDLPTGESGTS
jgi:hydrogenase expression/formation protein HypC